MLYIFLILFSFANIFPIEQSLQQCYKLIEYERQHIYL